MTDKAYSTHIAQLADLPKYIGKELGLTDWVQITQDRINTFADLTEDQQWIHIDAERSAKESPYGKTVAHGFLVLSLASKFAYETYSFGDVGMAVNYGLDRVRFPNATPVDALLRGRVSLMECKTITGGMRFKLKVEFELKDQEKPACVAEFLGQAYSSNT